MSEEMKNEAFEEKDGTNIPETSQPLTSAIDDFDYLLGENGFEIPEDD